MNALGRRKAKRNFARQGPAGVQPGDRCGKKARDLGGALAGRHQFG